MQHIVQTVTGEIATSQLGLTLVHEHLIADMYEVSLNSNLVLLDETVAAEELSLFGAAGGATVVDQTTIGLNPDPEALRRISRASGVRVIAATGVYWRRFRPPWIEAMDEQALTAMFVRDLTVGIGSSDVRAGIIGEIATSHRDIDAVEARVFRAAAAACVATGTPIATHALFNGIGLDQLSILQAAGAPPSKVVIGHSDTCSDRGYHLEILERGAWLGFDTVGQTDKATDDWRADRIVDLAGLGYLDQILVSSDLCRRSALSRNGGGGYGHVVVDFIPRLMDHGLSRDDVDHILIDNPRKLFE